jgi:hypothetical protein
MARETLFVNAGDVIEVQLTSETVVIDTPQGRRPLAEPGHIQNRMRLFLRETDGSEKKYDFDDTELGVRETQRVAVVRGLLKKAPAPVNLILFNLSSNEHDAFEPGLAAYLGHKPFFGPLSKAAALSFGTAIVFYLVSHYVVRNGQGAVTSGFLAIMFAFLAYPLFWWICGTWDRITERMRYKRARKQFIADLKARVQSYAAATTPQAPAA